MDHSGTQIHRFHWLDYVVFVVSILSSTIVGFIISYRQQFKRRKSQEIDGTAPPPTVDYGSSRMNEYLIGNREMGILPVSLSLIGSYVSGITILGTVSIIYNYGTQYCLILLSIGLMSLPVAFLYTPVFVSLGIHSSYEYLELRFGRDVRMFSALLFLYDEIIFLPMTLHIPSIAFNQVTGINSLMVSAALCTICMMYTIFGGLKAVVQTDAYQVAIMYISVLLTVLVGLYFAGGLEATFSSSNDGGRIIFFNMTPSFYEYNSFWGVLIGGFCYWTSFNSVNQTMVQRYMSLSSIKKAQQAIMIFSAGVAFFVLVLCIAGLLVFSFFKDCDPLLNGLIKQYDQLFPLYVMSTIGAIPGLCGLFISGIFGAALSSLSVVLNAASLVILEDITKGILGKRPTEKTSLCILYTSIFVLGVLSMATSALFNKLGSILGVGIALTAVAESTNFGLFTLGMLVPWCNKVGAIVGGISGFVVTAFLSLGNQAVYMLGYNVAAPYMLKISVEGCEKNITIEKDTKHNVEDVFPLFRLSFHWINPIGILVTVCVGMLVSYMFKPARNTDPNLLSPVIQKYMAKRNAEAK